MNISPTEGGRDGILVHLKIHISLIGNSSQNGLNKDLKPQPLQWSKNVNNAMTTSIMVPLLLMIQKSG